MSPTNYTARRQAVDGIDTVQLADSARKMELEIAPGVGNMAYKWNVGGRNYLYFPYPGVGAFAARPRLCGVPFLAPWANRLDGDAYWANGKRTCSTRPGQHRAATATRSRSTGCSISPRMDTGDGGGDARVRGPPAAWNSGIIRR